jgi:hypothetical protein
LRLQGAPQLQARLRAIQRVPDTLAKQQAEATAEAMKPMIPFRTGAGRRSVRVKAGVHGSRAEVVAHDYVAILDQGHGAYDIEPKRSTVLAYGVGGGRTIFSRKVHKPQQRGRGFAIKAVREGLRRHPLSEGVIKEWNGAA